MHIFVTGAAGFIGQALTKELIAHNHTVLGLSRSESNTKTLTSLGATPHPGALNDLASLQSGAAQADAVIHLAFIHDFSNLAASVTADQDAIKAFSSALAGTGKPLIIASGTLLVAGAQTDGGLATEDAAPVMRAPPFSLRANSAELVYEISRTENVRGMVVRLPPTVHGENDKGLVPSLVGLSMKNGKAVYVGDGTQRWPAVNVQDAAVLFRLAVEKGSAGATYHAVAEEGVSMKSVNELIGKKLGVEVESVPAAEAAGVLGFLGHVTALDNPCSSAKTREELGWSPTGPGLLEDMERFYFEEGAAGHYS